jgi:uncharacterized protein
MKRFVAGLILVVTSFIAPAAMAASATDQQVDHLMEVMRVEQTLNAILPQIRASQQQMVSQLTADKSLTDEQRKRLDAFLDRSSERAATALAWKNMQPVYRDIYRQTFTAEDIDAMVAFYGSQAGQNLLDKMPQLMQNSMAAVQKLLVPMLQGMQKDLEAEAAKAADPR